jgi:hypothetical protein
MPYCSECGKQIRDDTLLCPYCGTRLAEDTAGSEGQPVTVPFTVPMRSMTMLVLSNLVPLIGVWFLGWDRWSIVFLYWMESAVIGFYTILKMILAKGVPKKPVSGPGRLKLFLVAFFIIHFGGFMLVHLALLTGAHLFITKISGAPESTTAMFSVMLSGGSSLFLSHGVSFITNYWRGKEYERVTPGEVMISPYPRIVLMQFVSFFCFILFAPEIVMVFFKTIFDIIGHLLERRLFRKRQTI